MSQSKVIFGNEPDAEYTLASLRKGMLHTAAEVFKVLVLVKERVVYPQGRRRGAQLPHVHRVLADGRALRQTEARRGARGGGGLMPGGPGRPWLIAAGLCGASPG